MKKAFPILLSLLLIAAAASAQNAPRKAAQAPASSADSSLPTVDQILDRYVQALGGRAVISKVSSRVSKGTVEIPTLGVTGSFESFEKAPNKSLAKIMLTGFGEVRQGFDGTVAWSQDPQSGIREKSGVELAAARRDSDIHKDIKLRELYPTLALEGKNKVGERETYVIVATPAEGSSEKWYFDAETHLLLRADIEVEGPQGKLPAENYFDDYREVEGVKLPFTLRQSTSAFSIVTKIQEVKHNVPVEDSIFSKPADR